MVINSELMKINGGYLFMANSESMVITLLVNCYIAIENGPVEIVELPIIKMVILHSYGPVHQRVAVDTETDWLDDG